MRRVVSVSLALLLIVAATVAAHDLFLKPALFFVAPNSDVTLRVLNGTFTQSEAAVTADRVRDLSVVTPSGTMHPDTSAWRSQGDTSILSIRTGTAGTYVAGVSTRPRVLRLEAKDFNGYLASDGVPDVLEARRRNGELATPARERYSKHVKTILQVGDERSSAIEAVLGYPAELIPLGNPYSLRVGGVLHVRALVDGKPVARQYIVIGGRTPGGARIAQRSVRTDTAGVARVTLASRGQWYVKFIHMTRVAEDSVDYESKWASLTFEIR